MDKLAWCFSIKKGLERAEPNNNLSESYLAQAEKALSKVKKLIDEDDLVWASVRIYYSAYYSLYSFLQKIGIKSENHDCSIELAKKLLNKRFIDNIEIFKEERIDSQYYLKTGKKEKLIENYNQAKEFYLNFKEIIVNISEEDMKKFQSKIKKLMEK